MPGKQMAIDADLSSGLITEDEAKLRRSKIQREADFFGAMDGASKFVKGDAIIALIVVFIQLVGGVLVGLMSGQGSFGEIMNIYATSTVGNGLMSQIPALLISVATGRIFTRTASEGNLNEDLASQFTGQPMALVLAGVTMFALILIGFPPLQTSLIAGGVISLGIVLLRRQRVPALAPGLPEEGTEELMSEVSFYKNIDNVYGLLSVDPISMEFGYSLIPLVDESSGGTFVDRVVMFRKHFAQEMGLVFPSVRLKDSGQLNPNQYAINIKGEKVAEGEVLVDHFLALAPSKEEDTIEGIETVEPAFGMPAKWISADKQIKAELAGYTLIDPTSVIITHLSEVIKRHAHEMLSRQEVGNILTNLKKTNEAIVNDTIPAVVPIGTLQKSSPICCGRGAYQGYRDHPRNGGRLRRRCTRHRYAHRICAPSPAAYHYPPLCRGRTAQGYQPGRQHRKPDHGGGQKGGQRLLPCPGPPCDSRYHHRHHAGDRQNPRPCNPAHCAHLAHCAGLLQKAGGRILFGHRGALL